MSLERLSWKEMIVNFAAGHRLIWTTYGIQLLMSTCLNQSRQKDTYSHIYVELRFSAHSTYDIPYLSFILLS